MISTPLLFIIILLSNGCGWLPNPKVIAPLSTGHGNLPLLDLKLLEVNSPSLVSSILFKSVFFSTGNGLAFLAFSFFSNSLFSLDLLFASTIASLINLLIL